jgi:hypothetical protein
MDAVAIQLSRAEVGQQTRAIPDPFVREGRSVGIPLVVGGVKKTKLDFGGVFGKEGKIDPAAVPVEAPRG